MIEDRAMVVQKPFFNMFWKILLELILYYISQNFTIFGWDFELLTTTLQKNKFTLFKDGTRVNALIRNVNYFGKMYVLLLLF